MVRERLVERRARLGSSRGSIGVGVSIFSYSGGVTIGLRVDANLVPDPETIIDAFGTELSALARLKRRSPALSAV